MPTYARSYILPRVMKRSSLLEAKRRRQEQKLHEKKKSLETTGRGKRKVSSYVDADDAADEKFKWGMIKASLEYESNKLPASLREETDEEDDPKNARSRVPRKNESTKDFVKRTDTKSGRLPPPNSLLPVKGPGELRRYIKYVKDENYVPVPVLEPERGVDHGLFAKKGKKGAAGDESVTTRSSSRNSNLSQAHNSITAQYESIVKQVEAAVKASAEFKSSLQKKKKSSVHYSDIEALENVDLNVPQVSRATSRNTSRASSRVGSRAGSRASSAGSSSSEISKKRRRRRKKGRMPLPSLGEYDDVLLEEPDEEKDDGEAGQEPPSAAAQVPGSAAGDSGYSTGSFPTSVDTAKANVAATILEDDDLFGIGINVPTAKPNLLSMMDEREEENEDEELDRLLREAMRIARDSKLIGADWANEAEVSTTDIDGRNTSLSDATAAGTMAPEYLPKDSDAYREWVDANLLQDAMQGKNLLGMLEEKKPRFNDESARLRDGEGGGDDGREEEGASTLDLFIDRHVPFSYLSERHPVLQQVLTLIRKTKTDRGTLVLRGRRGRGVVRQIVKFSQTQTATSKGPARLSVFS